MAVVLGCKQGHRWDPDARASQGQPRDRCPVCGDLPLAEVFPASVLTGPGPGGGVQLTPSLPMSLFTSTAVWNPGRIHALALYCSDGRWGEAFDEFCQRRLLLPRYDRWAVPGGPGWVIARGQEHPTVDIARDQLGFLVRAHELERLVIITHYGCAYYGDLLKQGPDECLQPQMEEARQARLVLLSWFPALTVEAYLAMRTENRLSFHRLDA